MAPTDFVPLFPTEITELIFQCVPSADLLGAACVSKAWYAFAEYELLQNPRFSLLLNNDSVFAEFLSTWHKTVRQLGCSKRIRSLNLLFVNDVQDTLLHDLLLSGMWVDYPSFLLESPLVLADAAKRYPDELAAFVQGTKLLSVYIMDSQQLELLDSVLCNVRSITIHLNPGKPVRFHSAPKVLPFLEELNVHLIHSVMPTANTVDEFIRHYQTPKLARFSCNEPIEESTIRHVLSSRVESLTVNANTSARSVFSAASECNAHLKFLRFVKDQSQRLSVNADLTLTDLSCLSSLNSVQFDACTLSSVGLMRLVTATSGNLENVYVAGARGCSFDGDFLLEFLRRCPRLTTLCICFCKGFTSSSLASLRLAIDDQGAKSMLKKLDICDSAVDEAAVWKFFDGISIKLNQIVLSVDQFSCGHGQRLKRRHSVREIVFRIT